MGTNKKAVDVPPATQKPDAEPDTARLIVRVKPGGPDKRYRAGLGPFGAAPVEIAANPEQRAALEADAWLMVDGG